MSVNQIRAGIVLNYLLMGLYSLVGLFYTPYMLRMLGQSEYGLYSLVSTVIAYLTVLDLGLGSAVIRYTAKYRAKGMIKEQSEMLGMFAILYTIIGAVSFLLGSFLIFKVDLLFGDTMTHIEIQRARIMMIFLVLNLSLSFPLSIFGSVIQAYERFVFFKSLDLIRIALSTVVMIFLLYWGYKAISLVVTQTIFHISILILHLCYFKYKLKLSFIFGKVNKLFLKEVSIYSFWIFLMSIVDKIYWSTGQFVLGATIGTTAVAVFAVAIQLQTMYTGLSTSVSSLFLPKVTTMVTSLEKEKEVSDLFIKTGRIQFALLSFVLCLIIVFGKPFIIMWAGEDYEKAYMMLLLFLIPGTIPLVQNMGIVILQARNQMRFRAICYLIISILSLLLQILLVRYMGMIGSAVAISFALVIGHVICMNIYYKRTQKIDIQAFWGNISKMCPVPLVCIVLGLYIIKFYDLEPHSWFLLFFEVSVFASLYLPLAYLLQINNYERSLIISPFMRIKKFLREKDNHTFGL